MKRALTLLELLLSVTSNLYLATTKMNALSLFSGIGGLDLAAEAVGIRTVALCERDPWCRELLKARFPGVPTFDDVFDLMWRPDISAFISRNNLIDGHMVRIRDAGAKTSTIARLFNLKKREVRKRVMNYKGVLPQKEIVIDGEKISSIDVIHGGFPCQPFSVAGRQRGKDDNRYLWPEFSRLVSEIMPTWVVAENVSGILRIAADDVCKDLERLGYSVGIWCYEAAAVGAIHRRARVFFVGHAERGGLSGQSRRRAGAELEDGYPDISHTKSEQNWRLFMREIQTNTGTSCGLISDAHSERFTGDDLRKSVGRRRQTEGVCEALPDPAAMQRRSIERRESDGVLRCFSDVSHPDSTRPFPTTFRGVCGGETCSGTRHVEFERQCVTSPDADSQQREEQRRAVAGGEKQRAAGCCGWRQSESGLGRVVDGIPLGLDGLAVEPDIPRVANGVKDRVARLKALGNAVVPAQAYPIFRAIAMIEQEDEHEGQNR